MFERVVIIKLGSYRPARIAVAIMLIAALVMPAVTYACEMTGLVSRIVPIAMAANHQDDSTSIPHHADDGSAPCDHGSAGCDDLAADCGSDAMTPDECFVSYPGMEEGILAVSSKNQLVPVHDALIVRVEGPDLIRSSTPIYDREGTLVRNSPVPLHLAYSSFLL